MKHEIILHLDPVIHAPARLAILSILVSVEEANFTYLKEAIATTDGNLSTHLTKLENSAYITVKKFFKGKKPQTVCAITEKGRKAFYEYLTSMEKIVGMKQENNLSKR